MEPVTKTKPGKCRHTGKPGGQAVRLTEISRTGGETSPAYHVRNQRNSRQYNTIVTIGMLKSDHR